MTSTRSPLFTIRQAVVNDIPVLAYHRAAMFRDMGTLTPYQVEPLQRTTESYLAEAMGRGEYLAWIAEHAESPGGVLGGAGVQLRPILPRPRPGSDDLELGPEAIVLNVYVDPVWRRRGRLMFSTRFQHFAAALYGAHFDWSVRDTYFIRIVGSFAFVLGYLAAMAARDPLKHRIVIIAFIEFFVLRNVNRHLYSQELYSGFAVSPTVNDLTSVFFGAQALLLIVLLWRAGRRRGDTVDQHVRSIGRT